MATKRMFDKAIIDTDKFMDLPMPSKALYFLLGMESDDEGFVSYKKVMRIHGGNDDDIRILASKNFIIPFPSGVVVITDWNKNNWLDARRIKPTEYQNEKKLLSIDKENRYVLSNGLASIEECSIEERSVPLSIKGNKEKQDDVDFLAYYFEKFKKLIGDNLPIYTQRIVLPKIEAFAEQRGGYKKLRELLDIYFDTDKKFYQENNYSLTLFLNDDTLNKLNQ